MESEYPNELFEGDFAVFIQIGLDDGFIHYLLELNIIEIVPNHHFQNLKEFSV
jgi:hypothetical protein